MNPTQKMPDFRRGQPLRADALNHIVAAVLRMIVGGKGINVKSAAGKVVVEAEGQPIPRGGGGFQYYEVASESSLPNGSDVGSKSFARTIADPEGGFFVRNETNDGWFCLTHWR